MEKITFQEWFEGGSARALLVNENKKMELLKGFGSLLSSPRFQAILVAAVLQALVLFKVISGEQGEGLVLIIQGVLAAAVLNKTVDKVGDKNIIAAGVSAGTVAVEDVVSVPPTE